MDYFVDSGGSDGDPGTQAAPFATIQKAADIMRAGDRCLIRAGTYRETVMPARSGSEKARITFEAYEGERVVISGADIVSGPWTKHDGNIHAAAMPWTLGPGKDMVFVDGGMVIQARHPNTHTAPRKLPPIDLPPLWMTFGDFRVSLDSPDNATYALDIHDNILWQSSASRKAKFFKHNPPGDPRYFNNTEKSAYDGGVEGLQASDYPGGEVFRTGAAIKDEEDSWYP